MWKWKKKKKLFNLGFLLVRKQEMIWTEQYLVFTSSVPPYSLKCKIFFNLSKNPFRAGTKVCLKMSNHKETPLSTTVSTLQRSLDNSSVTIHDWIAHPLWIRNYTWTLFERAGLRFLNVFLSLTQLFHPRVKLKAHLRYRVIVKGLSLMTMNYNFALSEWQHQATR